LIVATPFQTPKSNEKTEDLEIKKKNYVLDAKGKSNFAKSKLHSEMQVRLAQVQSRIWNAKRATRSIGREDRRLRNSTAQD
jgi:hypothetical protein